MIITSKYAKSTIKQLWIQKVKTGIDGVPFVIDIIEILISDLKIDLDKKESEYINSVKKICMEAKVYKELITGINDETNKNFLKYKKLNYTSFLCLKDLYKIFWNHAKDTDIFNMYFTALEFGDDKSKLEQEKTDEDLPINIRE